MDDSVEETDSPRECDGWRDGAVDDGADTCLAKACPAGMPEASVGGVDISGAGVVADVGALFVVVWVVEIPEIELHDR